MEAPLDLFHASREALIARILHQREQIAALEQRLARHEAEVATQRAEMTRLSERVGALLMALDPSAGDDLPPRPTSMPGLKPASRRPPALPRPRQRRAQGYGRRRLRPTARQVHALAHCPHCRTALRGGTVKRTREVLDVVPTPVVMTEHVSLARCCPRCGGCWLPGPE